MSSLWRWLAVGLLTPLGLLYALPNLYPQAPAVQIGWTSDRIAAAEILADVRSELSAADIGWLETEAGNQSVTVLLADNETQLRVRDLLSEHFQERVVVALSLAERTPAWLSSLGAGAMKLGLDLSGGVHFLLEIDQRTLLSERLRARIPEIQRQLRENRVRWRGIEVDKQLRLQLRLARASDSDKAKALVLEAYTDLQAQPSLAVDQLRFAFAEQAVSELVEAALTQNLSALRNRVDALGVSEPIVRREGAGRIAVELPGIQDTAAARRIIGRTATLEFRLEAEADTPLSRRRQFPFRDGRGDATLLTQMVTTGEHVVNARPSFDSQSNQPVVSIQLDAEGGDSMFRTTRNNVGRSMGVLLVESNLNPLTGERQVAREILTLPVIRGTFGSSFQIEGVGSVREASELALLLRSGALAAPMDFLTERVIGPTLGAENIRLGLRSALLGLFLVGVFMLVRYRFLGLVANIALMLNLTLVMAMMSVLEATLTLPGIAGLVLTVGMAVDANVLIFERIREERAAGKPPSKALESGYDQAFITILDANLTTLLAAVVLYAIGTGPVRGFAITLSLGILTSMFTAVTLTRALAGARLSWSIPAGPQPRRGGAA